MKNAFLCCWLVLKMMTSLWSHDNWLVQRRASERSRWVTGSEGSIRQSNECISSLIPTNTPGNDSPPSPPPGGRLWMLASRHISWTPRIWIHPVDLIWDEKLFGLHVALRQSVFCCFWESFVGELSLVQTAGHYPLNLIGEAALC